MNFELTTEHLAIRDMAERFLGDQWSPEHRRLALDQAPVSVSDELWGQIAQAGWLGINARESIGGAEQDLLATAMLVEQAGQHLFPNTLITALVAVYAMDQSSVECAEVRELCRAVVEGRKFISVAVEAHPRSEDDVRADAPFTDRECTTISGRKFMVPDLARAEELLLTCVVDDRRILVRLNVDAPGLSWTPLERIDGQSYFDVVLDKVPICEQDILGTGEESEALARRVQQYWTLLLAADLLGCTTHLLNRTVDYCRERVQFGRPIGSFQAVSHRLADIKVDEEIGRSLLYGASASLQTGGLDATPYVSAAKAWLSEAAVRAGEASIQLHGGIGYTWELDVHLYLRQVRCNAVQLGDARFHRERIAGHILEDPLPGRV